MTLGTQVSYAERRARTDSAALNISADSDVTRHYINEGVKEFAERSNGLPKEDYLTVTPKFDVRTNFAVRITITGGGSAIAAADWVLAATNYTDLTGASLASYLNNMLSANLSLSAANATMSWSTASWIFTLRDNLACATNMEMGEPLGKTYVDYLDFLFNKSGTQNTAYFEGTLPMDCTVEVTLPDDFLEIQFVEWDGYPLGPAPYDLFMSPGHAGNPLMYTIKGKRMRLCPYPNEQKMLHIRYKYMPDDFETDSTDDAEDCPLPTETHMAPVFYAAAQIAAENEDDDIYKKNMGLFIDEVTRYRMREANQTPTLFPNRAVFRPIKVVIPD